MKDFYLTTAVAVVIITSLASNLLWVMAFGPAAPGLGTRLRSALGETVSGLRYPLDAWVAGLIARRERQAATSGLEDLADRDLRDVGLCRNDFGLMSPEPSGHFGAGAQLSRLLVENGRPR